MAHVMRALQLRESVHLIYSAASITAASGKKESTSHAVPTPKGWRGVLLKRAPVNEMGSPSHVLPVTAHSHPKLSRQHATATMTAALIHGHVGLELLTYQSYGGGEGGQDKGRWWGADILGDGVGVARE